MDKAIATIERYYSRFENYFFVDPEHQNEVHRFISRWWPTGHMTEYMWKFDESTNKFILCVNKLHPQDEYILLIELAQLKVL